MKYLEKIVEHKSSLVLIFLILSLIVTLFTNIDLLDFITSPINNLNYSIILYGKNRCKKIITQRVV